MEQHITDLGHVQRVHVPWNKGKIIGQKPSFKP